MRRVPNYIIALDEFLESRRNSKWEWGKHDCCMFVVGAIEAQTGVEVSDKFKGYTTEAGANSLVSLCGGVDGIAAEVMEQFGCSEVLPSFAQRGDPVVVVMPTANAEGVLELKQVLGIIGPNGQEVLIAQDADAHGCGFRAIKIHHVKRAWRLS